METKTGILEGDQFANLQVQIQTFAGKDEAIKGLRDEIQKKISNGYQIVEGEKVGDVSINSALSGSVTKTISFHEKAIRKRVARGIMTNLTEDSEVGELGKREEFVASPSIRSMPSKKLRSAEKEAITPVREITGKRTTTSEWKIKKNEGHQENPGSVKRQLDLNLDNIEEDDENKSMEGEIEGDKSMMLEEIMDIPSSNNKFSTSKKLQPATPKSSHRAAAIKNSIPVPSKIFLTPKQIKEVFTSNPPKSMKKEGFKGVYLERKVLGSLLPGIPKEDQDRIFTEYYSLQLSNQHCYFEYGVIEEPDFLQSEMHETEDFKEAFCLVKKLQDERQKIGFTEKSEKLVNCLNSNLVNSMKKKKSCYTIHQGRISQKSSVNGKGSEIKLEEENGENENTQEVDEIVVSTPQKQDGNMVQEEKELSDEKPQVNVREDLGQSDICLMYENHSHSNPCHIEDIDALPKNIEVIDIEKRRQEMLENEKEMLPSASKLSEK